MNNSSKKLSCWAGLLAASLLTACSGLPNSKSEFACQAPENVSCNSVLGTYLNTLGVSSQAKFLNTQQKEATSASYVSGGPMGLSSTQAAAKSLPALGPNSDYPQAKDQATGMIGEYAIDYMPAQTLRMWIAPYVDDENNYLGSRFVHLVLRSGGWSPVLPRAGQATTHQGLLVKRTVTDASASKENTKSDSRTAADQKSDSSSSAIASGLRAIISPATTSEQTAATPARTPLASSAATNNGPSMGGASSTVPSFLAPR